MESDKYKLVRDGIQNISRLETTVNQLISDGWIAIGPIQIIQVDKQTILIQQMEKRV